MHAKAERVQEELRRRGIAGDVRELPESTRTSGEAAEAVGTTPAQIAKSLVFLAGGEPLLVIAAGDNRVDLDKVGRHVGEPVRPADAKAAKQLTGYSVGGVPPVGHATPLRTLIDQELGRHGSIWAAAGTPRAVFPTTCDELARVTAGEVVSLAERS